MKFKVWHDLQGGLNRVILRRLHYSAIDRVGYVGDSWHKSCYVVWAHHRGPQKLHHLDVERQKVLDGEQTCVLTTLPPTKPIL